MLTKVVALAFAASAVAQSISLVRPGPDQWWVANSKNTLQWAPCPDSNLQAAIPAFNVVVMNSNQQILAGNLTILGNEPTFDCSKTITPSLVPAPGYTLMLTNAINTLQVYTSVNFEVKAAGATYPPEPPVSSSSASGSGTASGSSPSQSGGGGSSDASALEVSIKSLLSMVLGVGTLRALL